MAVDGVMKRVSLIIQCSMSIWLITVKRIDTKHQNVNLSQPCQLYRGRLLKKVDHVDLDDDEKGGNDSVEVGPDFRRGGGSLNLFK